MLIINENVAGNEPCNEIKAPISRPSEESGTMMGLSRTDSNDDECSPGDKSDQAQSLSQKNAASGSNLGRRGDPRMHKAVAARIADPSMSLLEALTQGGFHFVDFCERSGKSDRDIYDVDGVQLCQRKNQLSRRLRLLRKRGDAKAASVAAKNTGVTAPSNAVPANENNGSVFGAFAGDLLASQAMGINMKQQTTQLMNLMLLQQQQQQQQQQQYQSGAGGAGRFYDDDDFAHDNGGMMNANNSSSITGEIASRGKRAISSLVFGPSSPTTSSQMRSRKCRKMNHSSVTPPLLSAIVPGFILRASTAVMSGFGSMGMGMGRPNLQGGAIMKLTLDRDRKTMYALTVNGFIHAFDLDTAPNNSKSRTTLHSPRLACTINVTKSVQRYLESVSHGRPYPPSNSGTDSSLASIRFPGGGSCAQAGVGGMDGARSILKTADAEVMKKKARRNASNSSSSSSSSTSRSGARARPTVEGCLHPISIHIVPSTESKFLTLVAISAGGLRYYLSVLPDAGTTYGNGVTSNNSVSVKPGRRFTLCHVRAPPLYHIGAGAGAGNNRELALDSTMQRGLGAAPCMAMLSTDTDTDAKGRVSKSCYTSGVTLLAIGCGNEMTEEHDHEHSGDSILALTPNFTTAPEQRRNVNSGASSSSSENGLSEIASQPTAVNRHRLAASILPGGHVWELDTRQPQPASDASALTNLFTKSTTPSDFNFDSSQSEKLLPAYLPPRPLANRNRGPQSQRSTTSLDTAINTSRELHVPVGYGYGLTTLLKTILFGRQSSAARRPRVSTQSGQILSYRISNRFGCYEEGFSSTAMAKSSSARSRSRSSGRLRNKSSGRGQSARVSQTILNPSPTPLSDMASQHLSYSVQKKGILALNSGGLHYFTQSSPIEKLRELLLDSNSAHIGRDEHVKMFFQRYGYSEGCATSLTIAVMEDNNEALVRKSISAAMSYARRPTLARAVQSGSGHGTVTVQTTLPSSSSKKIKGFEDYTFIPSSLHDGLVSLVSRLLRAIWCKPAVVVTEGRTIAPKRKGMMPKHLPAKVELLLDDATLEEVRRPLAALQRLMREVFEPAIKNVPGAPNSSTNDAEMADISSSIGRDHRAFGGSDLITNAVQYQAQAQARSQNNSNSVDHQQPSEKDLNMAARLNEERNLHALYRLVSRSIQLLTLISHMYRAHQTPELPEIEFGFLHGLTFSQLVTLNSAQDRIEAILTDIFSKSSTQTSSTMTDMNGNPMSSIESDNLCTLLSRDCYLYFSIGSRLTFNGFRDANAALTEPSLSRRNELINSSSNSLRLAARHWHNQAHVTGRIDDSEIRSSRGDSGTGTTKVSYNELAIRALENGSPLARAASALLEVGDVVGIVDVCLSCAQNFTSSTSRPSELSGTEDIETSSMLPWERSLYHRQTGEVIDSATASSGMQSPSSPNISATKESRETVKNTCYAVLYYHLNILLDSVSQNPQNSKLVEKMLSISTSSPDNAFIHGLYEYLSTSGHIDTLLRIDSSSLENWLKINSQDHHLLLWRYYNIHNIHWMAGEVMWNQGNDEEKVPLDDRVQCFTRAIGSYSTALSDYNRNNVLLRSHRGSNNSQSTDSLSQRYGMSPSKDELNKVISQITEQIDVAKIQTRVLSAILSSQNAGNVNPEKMDELRNSLVNVSALYNDFTAPLGLYDLCLAILQTCQYNETATITKLWRSILCEELLPCRTNSNEVSACLKNLQRGSMLEEESVIVSSNAVTKENGDSLLSFDDGEWIAAIKTRIITLGKEFHGKGSDFVFPLHFIAECTEGLAHAYKSLEGNSSPEHWPLKTLVESGADFPSILEAYHYIFTASQSEASEVHTRLRNLSNIGEMIKMWVATANASPSNGLGETNPAKLQLSRYSSAITSQIDAYKAELESLVGCRADQVSEIYSLFSDIEKALQRNW
mmetsp:Transcript_9535/g.13832  ORF Transcript_9535/g.13832 Transcript_9535/m.13832 type:complete len:1914 (-) Transcript_9535:86-5827(-)